MTATVIIGFPLAVLLLLVLALTRTPRRELTRFGVGRKVTTLTWTPFGC